MLNIAALFSRLVTDFDSENTITSVGVSDFDSVRLNGAGALIIEQTGHESLTIEGPKNVVDQIKTSINKRTLNISLRRFGFVWPSLPAAKVKYRLTVNELKHIGLIGSGQFKTKMITGNELGILIKGSGNGTLIANVNDMIIRISGSGSVVSAGVTNKQEIMISGSGNYAGRDLSSNETNIIINGSGSGLIRTNYRLDAVVNGSGRIFYSGSPKVTQNVSGSGIIAGHKGD